MLCLYLTNLTVSLIKVRVFNPKKSIFNKPASSTTELSNWVTYKSESLAVATGTNCVISSGVMITPQAWIPVFRNEPSKTLACCMVSPERLSSSAKFLISLTRKTSSARSFSLSWASVALKIFPSFMLGNNLAIRSASPKGKSNTRAVSRIDDLAAIVP